MGGRRAPTPAPGRRSGARVLDFGLVPDDAVAAPATRGAEPDELYGDVVAARDAAHVTLPLGDGSPLDELVIRDHVIGLEAELANARAEAAHARKAAEALRRELGQTLPVRVLRGLRMARRVQLAVARRRAARTRS